MKKLVLSIALAVSSIVFSQSKDINEQLQTVSKVAMDAYTAKNYSLAAPKFLEVYNLLKTNGQEDKIYLYYSGLNYALANNSTEAIKIYNELLNAGFTGIQTNYTAKNVKTGEVTPLDKNTWDLLKGKSKDYSDFKTEETPSVEPDLYETLSTLLINDKKYAEAIVVLEKGIQKFPDNAKLKSYLGTAYYNTGNTDKFTQALKEEVTKDPNNYESWYNLGVMQSKNPATSKDAISSFQKAISIKPDYANAHQNLVYTTIGDDPEAVAKINTLRKSNPDEATKLIDERRARFKAALPFAESWFKVAPTDLNAVTALKEIYSITKNQAKVAEMKEIEAKLQAK